MKRLAVLGAGSWGTALAIALEPRFEEVHLWAFDRELPEQIAATRENPIYLPGFRIPERVIATASLGEAIEAAECVLLVIPSQHLRRVVRQSAEFLDRQQILVSATKGIEGGSLKRMSELLHEETQCPVAVLSGPTFAREVAAGEPAAVVLASDNRDVAVSIQAAFSGPCFRLYTNSDVIGVEIGGSLKNVVA
ncbi:MAG TPA: NAD(P)-binding domain-containing protein, partial [Bryobacteraceae bacterium]|nr:NAD(P)-binding domain-containing protein [Bryobacteraceae bacterium]